MVEGVRNLPIAPTIKFEISIDRDAAWNPTLDRDGRDRIAS
jgi:hypothetical protein